MAPSEKFKRIKHVLNFCIGPFSYFEAGQLANILITYTEWYEWQYVHSTMYILFQPKLNSFFCFSSSNKLFHVLYFAYSLAIALL